MGVKISVSLNHQHLAINFDLVLKVYITFRGNILDPLACAAEFEQ